MYKYTPAVASTENLGLGPDRVALRYNGAVLYHSNNTSCSCVFGSCQFQVLCESLKSPFICLAGNNELNQAAQLEPSRGNMRPGD